MSSLLDHPNLPKYVKFAEHLRAQIVGGALRAGDRVPSFAQVKEQHGLSQNTLEKAHALLEKEGLIVRKQGVGTFVCEFDGGGVAASALGTKTLGFAGFGSSHLAHEADVQGMNHYWIHLLQGVQSAAGDAQAQMTLLDHNSSTAWGKVDAIVATWDVEASLIEERTGGKVPWVRLLLSYGDAPAVVADDRGGAQLLTEHLLRLGHRRIGYITTTSLFSQQRLDGYCAALSEADVAADDSWIRHFPAHNRATDGPLNFVRTGQAIMENWLRDGFAQTGCTAILAQNDQTAVGIIEACKAAGLRVPEDVSVAGFDDTEAAQYFLPHLTTIHVPLFEMGQKAAQLALEPQENAGSQTLVLPTRLVARQSTATPRVGAKT